MENDECICRLSLVTKTGESDEKPFGPADVAEPIRVLIPDYVAHELCAELAKPPKRFIDIVYGEHEAEVA
jgi:hypothetical protein